jgi:hypothetical protein
MLLFLDEVKMFPFDVSGRFTCLVGNEFSINDLIKRVSFEKNIRSLEVTASDNRVEFKDLKFIRLSTDLFACVGSGDVNFYLFNNSLNVNFVLKCNLMTRIFFAHLFFLFLMYCIFAKNFNAMVLIAFIWLILPNYYLMKIRYKNFIKKIIKKQLII